MNPSHPDLTRMSERDLLILALDALSALNNTVSTLSEQVGDDAIANYYKTFEPVVERYTRCHWDDAQITGSVEPSSASCGSSTSIVQKYMHRCGSNSIRVNFHVSIREISSAATGNTADNAGDTDDDGIDIFEDEDEEYDPFLAPLWQQQQQQQQHQPQQPQRVAVQQRDTTNDLSKKRNTKKPARMATTTTRIKKHLFSKVPI
ncbi:hypothetical protein BJV82DRAFT_661889 [Fennellomyces sp. T-0311]|nr:hypothetical protein BJV82DRAFT_661889 [Fennellomyces sp. T-0311]